MRLEEEISQKSFRNEFQKGVLNITFTAGWLKGRFKSFFKEYDITSQQYNILRILRGQSPDPATINLLKDRMLEPMSDASRLVDRLASKGLIDKATSKEDKRAANIFISGNGLKLLSTIDSKITLLESVLSELSEEEVKTLNYLLDKIRDRPE